MHFLIKNPSKQELKLRQIIKELYPESEPTYQVLNYDIDIAIPSKKVAIEYDGWYHFCDQNAINYHNKRQKEIEKEGWKFVRYNIFQTFPLKEEIQKDITKAVGENNGDFKLIVD